MNLDLPTFLFQLGNFLVLVAILWRLLWKPLRSHMVDRAELIATGLRTIQEGGEELAETRARLAEELARAKSARDEARALGERDAEESAKGILEAAHRAANLEGERLRAQVLSEQKRQEREFLRTLVPDLTRLIERILTELGGEELHTLACDRFAREVESLPETEVDRFRTAARKSAPELVTARPEPTARLSAAVTSLLPDHVQPKVKEDASLGAGARLCIGETVLDGSLAAQVTAAMESPE